MRPARHGVAAIALVAAAAVTLSGCGLVDYYREGGEQLWGHVSGAASADAALDELAQSLRADHPVQAVTVLSRALAIHADAQLEVTLMPRATASDWSAVADDIATAAATDELTSIRLSAVLTDATLRVESRVAPDSDLAARVSAAAQVADEWGAPIRVDVVQPPAAAQLRITADAHDDPAVTAAFVRAAPELQAITANLGIEVEWNLPGCTGRGIAPAESLGLLLDPPLPLAPTQRYTDVAPGEWPREYLGLMFFPRAETAGQSVVHVGLDVDGRFDEALGWRAYTALVRRAVDSADGQLALSASWVIGAGENAVSVQGGIRVPADDCVMPPADAVTGLELQDQDVADALVRAGVSASAFSVGAYCLPTR